MGKHAQSSTVYGAIQFAAAGSVLDNIPSKIHPAERLLKEAVWWIDAAHESAGSQTITNLGWGGSALNATAGSSGSADSNDPKFLDWTGGNYVYLPGVASNYLSVPDENALDITGDIDIRARVALDDWTPAALSTVVSRDANDNVNQAWLLSVRASNAGVPGGLRFQWYPNGTSASVITADSTVAPTVADGAALWIRVVLDVDDGGVYKVYFYTSADGVSWTQLGTTVTGGATTSIPNVTAPVIVGLSTAGSFYRAIVKNGIDGPTVLDVDCSQITSGSATSFTARTGQTVTINRSTSGRKSVAVTQPCWLFGTDDYLEVPDNDLLDFGASDSFTVLAVVRSHGTPSGYPIFLAKTTNAEASGYVLRGYPSVNDLYAIVGDGTSRSRNIAGYVPNGPIGVLGMVANRSDQTLALTSNGTLSGTSSISAYGSFASTAALRVGSWSNTTASGSNFEFVAAAVFRRALTASEIQTLSDYYAGR